MNLLFEMLSAVQHRRVTLIPFALLGVGISWEFYKAREDKKMREYIKQLMANPFDNV